MMELPGSSHIRAPTEMRGRMALYQTPRAKPNAAGAAPLPRTRRDLYRNGRSAAPAERAAEEPRTTAE
jgi:hypothetical protein